MIIESERSGKTISDICMEFGVSRQTWYKWKRRYNVYGLQGLKNLSKRPHNIKNIKVTKELEKIILELLRLNHRFGPMRIRSIKEKVWNYLRYKRIYNLLKRHNLNVLYIKIKRKYKRFEMKHPNELVQMDTKGPFYLKGSRDKHHFIHVIDDCSRKVVSKWCNRRTSEESLSVLKQWVELYGKPMKVMHDGGREFTSNKFKNFLFLNGIKDKQIPKGYPQEQGGKVEAYNKIVIAEFLQVEALIDMKDGLEKYESFVNSYNYEREHGGINGMTPSEKYTKYLKQPMLVH
jgi:transposase InsO family protein